MGDGKVVGRLGSDGDGWSMSWWREGVGLESALGLQLGELGATFGTLDVGGYLAAAVDNCGVVTVTQEAPDLLEG